MKSFIPIMSKYIRNQALLLGATLLGTILLAGITAHAADLYQYKTMASGWNWNSTTNIWGATPSSLSAAVAGNTYISGGVGTNFTLRTYDQATNNPLYSTFVGDKLILTNNGIGKLFLKTTGGLAGMAKASIELAGGVIGLLNANSTPADVRGALGGTILVSQNSSIAWENGATPLRDNLLVANVSGTANLAVYTTNTTGLVLLGTNTAFSGNWTNVSGRIEIGNNALDALGSGKLILVSNAPPRLSWLMLNATNDFTVLNVIEGLGNVVKAGSNTVTLSGANTFTGSTVVSNGVLKLSNASAISTSTNISLRGGTVDATTIGGLTLTTGNSQSVDCNGSVTGNLTVDAVNALNFNVTSTTNDILNVSGSLALVGTPTIYVSVPAFKAAGTYRLITYTGAAFSPGAFNLTLVGVTSQIYSLSYSAGQVNLVVVGAPKHLTWLGGTYWDLTSLNWTNSGGLTPTNFATGDTVTFDDSATDFNVEIEISTVLIPAGMTVSNAANAYTFQGGGIAPAATLTKKGGNILAFTSPSNNITGPIDIQAGLLSVGVGGGFGALGAPSSITNNGTFRVNLASGGPTLNCPISGSGAVEVLGACTLTLTGSNSYTGFTTINNGCQLNYSGTNALGTPASGTRVLADGRLGVIAAVGTISVPEPLFINGAGVAVGPGALYLAGANNRLNYTGPVTVESDSRIRLINSPVFMTFSNTVAGNNVRLWCTAGNAAGETGANITFANSLTLDAGGSFLKDGPGVVNLNSAVNTWGSTVVNSGTLSVNNQLDGGTVTVNGGALGGSGTVNGAIDVQAGGSIAPGNNGIGTLTLSSTLSYAAGAANLMQINRTNVQTADKLVAASIPLSGTVLNLANTGPALQFGDSFDLFDGTISGPVPTISLTGNGFAAVNYVWDTSALLSSGVITVSTSSIPFLPLAITKFDVQPTTLGLTWTSFTNLLYTIQYSTNLASTNWSVAQANIPGTMDTNSTTQLLSTVVPVTSANYTLVQYQMGTANAQIQDATKTMAAGSLTAGPGVSLFNANANVTPVYTNPVPPELQVTAINLGADLSTAEANQTWFTFTLTVGTGVTDLDLTSLSFSCGRGAASTPRGFGVYVTTPTTTDELVQGATDVATARPVYTAYDISLAGLVSLQNLTAGQVVTFKIPFYAPAAASSLEFDDITVKGNVSPGVPAGYVGANPLFLRINQQ